MIHLKISKTKEHYYDVFDGMLPIATLLAKGAGIIELRPSEIFRKHNGFGVNEELLNDTTIPFKHVVIIFKGKNYHATREEFLEKGIEESFEGFSKLFLPISRLRILNDKQLQLPFPEVSDEKQ